jgi:hypothetical protein
MMITLPLVANRLSVIDTGTVVGFSVVKSALADKLGLFVNTPRLAGRPATTQVAAPAELHVRHVEPAPR